MTMKLLIPNYYKVNPLNNLFHAPQTFSQFLDNVAPTNITSVSNGFIFANIPPTPASAPTELNFLSR